MFATCAAAESWRKRERRSRSCSRVRTWCPWMRRPGWVVTPRTRSWRARRPCPRGHRSTPSHPSWSTKCDRSISVHFDPGRPRLSAHPRSRAMTGGSRPVDDLVRRATPARGCVPSSNPIADLRRLTAMATRRSWRSMLPGSGPEGRLSLPPIWGSCPSSGPGLRLALARQAELPANCFSPPTSNHSRQGHRARGRGVRGCRGPAWHRRRGDRAAPWTTPRPSHARTWRSGAKVAVDDAGAGARTCRRSCACGRSS